MVFLLIAISGTAQAQTAPTQSIAIIREDCSLASIPTANCYTSLSSWEAGENRDLVASDEIAIAQIEGNWINPDTTGVIIDGWTTDETHYIKIYTALDARHDGKWNINKYRLEINTANTFGVNIKEEAVRIDGVQILMNTNANKAAIETQYNNGALNSTYYISNNILRAINPDSYDSGIFTRVKTYGITNSYIWNNIIYGFTASSNYGIIIVETDINAYIYNNTVYNNKIGIEDRSGNTVTAINNAVFSNDNDFNGTFALLDYNASDDGNGTNAVIPSDWTTVFTDVINMDFHLLSTNTDLIGAGMDNPGLGLYLNDIDDELRTSTWDIGADEFIGL